MPEEGSTYASAIRESAAKAGGTSAPESATETERQGGSAPESVPAATKDAAVPKEAEAIHPLLADVDLSGLSEKEQATVLAKVKAYDKAFHRERASYQEFKQFQKLYQENPSVEKAIQTALRPASEDSAPRATRTTMTAAPSTKAEAAVMKRLDTLLAEAKTSDEREAIRESRQIILEETQEHRQTVESLGQKLDELERTVAQLRQDRSETRLSKFDQELDQLEEAYAPSLVEKYRSALRQWAEKYPTRSAEWLLYKIAEPKELQAAALPPVKGAGSPKGASKPTRPAGSVTATSSNGLDESFKVVDGRSKTWALGKVFRHLAAANKTKS